MVQTTMKVMKVDGPYIIVSARNDKGYSDTFYVLNSPNLLSAHSKLACGIYIIDKYMGLCRSAID